MPAHAKGSDVMAATRRWADGSDTSLTSWFRLANAGSDGESGASGAMPTTTER
jgi:hypothetical protein